MNIQEFRKQYPQYDKVGDEDLSRRLYDKYYAGKIEYDEFAQKFGVQKTDEIVDKSTGFLNNFTPRQIKQFMEEQSMPAGIMKYATGQTDKAVEERKQKAGMDVDPTERYLNSVAEEAFQKGGHESPDYQAAQAELDTYVKEKDQGPNLSIKSVYEAAKADPGGMLAEFGKAIIADPELMLTPVGWEKAAAFTAARTAKLGTTASKAVGIAAGAAGAGAVAGGLGVPISIAQQLGEKGEVDPRRVMDEAVTMGVTGAIAVGIFRAFPKNLLNKENFAKVREHVAKGVEEEKSIASLTDDILGDFGLSKEVKPKIEKSIAEIHAHAFAKQGGMNLTVNEIPGTGFLGKGASRAQNLDLEPWQIKLLGGEIPKPKPIPKPEVPGTQFLGRGASGAEKVYESSFDPGTSALGKGASHAELVYSKRRENVSALGGKASRAEVIESLNVKDSNVVATETGPALRESVDTATRPMASDASITSGEIKKLRGLAERDLLPEDSIRFASKELRDSHSEGRYITAEKALTEVHPGWRQAMMKQRGAASSAALGAVAATGTGALVGYALDGEEGAVAGALLAGAGMLGAIGIVRVTGKIIRGLQGSTKKQISVDHLVDNWEAEIASGQLKTFRLMNHMQELVPDKARREAITHWLEGDKTIRLVKSEQEVADAFARSMDTARNMLQKEGMLDDFLDNFVAHFWKRGVKTKSEIMRALEGDKGGTGMALTSMHTKKRKIPTYREGLKIGLIPQTLDVSEIYKLYMDNVYRVAQNRRLVNAIKLEVDMQGRPLIMAAGKAPEHYVDINHPSLAKTVVSRSADGTRYVNKAYVKVHPDIADHLKFVFDNTDPKFVARMLLALNFASKRSLVGLSFFHANALLESLIFAGRHPAAFVKGVKALKDKKYATNSRGEDVVDIALRAGLKIGSIEDVGLKHAYGIFDAVSDYLVKWTPGPMKGLTKGGLEKFRALNQKFDEIMWDKIMTGGKLAVFMREYEKAIAKNVRQHAKNQSKYPLADKNMLSVEIAEYVNDAFGGLNWRRMAMSAKTHLGKKVFGDLYSPSGRKWLQLGLFAADWTIANFRVLLRGLIPGYARSARQQKLHLWYAARGAVFFATAGSMVNMYFTGRPIWENEDPTRIDLGDGRTMVWSKQFVEPAHWVSEPWKTFSNKLGIIPGTMVQLATNKKYVSPYGAPDIWRKDDHQLVKMGKGLGHLTYGRFVPITAQQIYAHGAQGAAGFFGHPIYGEKDDKKLKVKRLER